MNGKEYIENALKTESNNFKDISYRLDDINNIRLLHAGLGLITESAEIADALKKAIYYGKPLDKINLKEELGDIFWYLAIACNQLNLSFEEIWQANIEKLHTRYGISFNEEGAMNRDLTRERYVLEEDSNRSHFIGCLKQVDISYPCTCDQLKDKEQKVVEITNPRVCLDMSCTYNQDLTGKHLISEHILLRKRKE